MKAAVRQQWVAALRSGQYKQGRGRLRDKENNFCCLGVLCNLFDSQQWHEPVDNTDWFTYGGEEFSCSPPSEVGYWSGLGQFSNPGIPASYVQKHVKSIELPDPFHPNVSLAELNDKGATFEEIATLIENYF